MSKLNLLLVEDNDTDALLVVRQLRKEGFEVEHTQVKTGAEMELAFARGNWDIVISDYSLPGFGGGDALKLFKSKNLDIPFILVSGTVGEEIAVNIMKGGANDYLMKTHLNRLGPAVKRELEETVMKREKRRIENTLTRTEQRFQRLIQDILDVVWLSNIDGSKIYLINSAFDRLYGSEFGEIKMEPRKWHELVAVEDRPAYHKFTEELKLSGVGSLEYRINRADGSERWVMDQRYIVQGDDDGENMVGGILSDITEKKKSEQELIQAKKAAEESSRLKSALLQNMSHEFRTPMNGILGFSDILMTEVEDQRSRSMIQYISSSGKRLQHTLDSIMLFAQLEGGLSLNMAVTDCAVVLREIFRDLLPAAGSKGLIMELNASEPLRIVSDCKLIDQAIRNLVENAIKFTQQGKINVTAKKTDRGDPEVEITIADTGIGIPAEKQHIIFEEFRQANEGYDRPYEGSGLGLSITRKCIQLLNGTLTLKSAPGQGSEFTIRLPATPPPGFGEELHEVKGSADAVHIPVIVTPEIPEILLVEDNDSNIELIKLFLKDNYRLEIAYEGEQALQMVKLKQYDVILMDINLGPGMDGIDAIEGIRKFSNYQSTPIIAVTGYTFRNEKNYIISKGADHYLEKPFKREVLTSLLQQVLKTGHR